MHSFPFVPRPFPPPALAGVPIEYIIDQLHRLAPHYWSKPETADCTVVVPLPYDVSRPKTVNTQAFNGVPETLAEPVMGRGSSVHGRRATDPVVRPAPRMVLKLHMDYLCAHSTLLRGLLGGASPFDLLSSTSTPPLTRQRSPSNASSQRPAPTPLLPALLPSPPTHPVIFLPVPDPRSLRLLIHFVYFGSTAFIEDALDRGELSWEGIARNVEYLGMGSDIKMFLGRWYGRWKRGRGRAEDGSGSDSDNESCYDEDLWGSGDEDGMDTDEDESITTSTTLLDPDEMAYMDLSTTKLGGRYTPDSDDDKSDPPRGRQRTTRRLGHSTSDPHFDHTRRIAQAELSRSSRGRSE